MTTTENNLVALIIKARETMAQTPDRIDPTGKAAQSLRNWIKGIENADGLRIIANADIKWASSMAATQLIIRGEPTA